MGVVDVDSCSIAVEPRRDAVRKAKVPSGKSEGKKGATAPATAPGQALGYGVQYTRLTAMLLNAPEGSLCSLEVMDDVAQNSPGSKSKVVQSKNVLSDSNPVADRAVSLWKTLFNWKQLIEGGLVDPSNTIFELYISRKMSGDLIAAFHAAKSVKDAKSAIERARTLLWGAKPKFKTKGSLPTSLARYVNPVLEGNDEVLVSLIQNVHLECGSGSPQADLETLIRSHPVSPSRVSGIADKLCGWVKREVDRKLEQKQPAVISRDEFHREYVSFVRSIDRDILLQSFSKKPSRAEQIERLPDIFVQQLAFINLSFDEKLAAISDFLRASADRAEWSKSGDVNEASFIDLNDALSRAWANLKTAAFLEASGKADTERGQLLHARCMMHKAKLQAMEVPGHFVPGCFHDLANDMILGWHPEYKKLLKPIGKAA